MAMTLMSEEISFYVRKAKIHSEGLGHRGKLLTEPQKLVVLCLHMARTLVTYWQSLANLPIFPHVKRPLANLRKIINNVRTKKELRIGRPGVKIK